MNELAKINENLPKYVQVRVGFKAIKSLSEPEIKRECAKIISQSFAYISPNGQTSAEILTYQTNELFNALKGRYSTLTLPEVQRAFKMGLNEEFGVYFGMCGKSYNLFLKSYFDNPERGHQWNKYLDSQTPVVEKPIHITEFRTKESLIKRFERYKETGDIGLVAHYAYDLLKQFKGVQSLISLEQFKAIKSELKQPYIDRLCSLKDKAERTGDFNEAEKIGGVLADIDNSTGLINLMKGRALKVYFDSIDELGI